MDPESVEALFRSRVSEGLERWIPAESAHYQQTREFALGRLEEGRQLGAFFSRRWPGEETLRVLDIGSGNGGVAIGVAESDRFDVTATDILIHEDLFALRNQLRLRLDQVVGVGEALPFRDASFHIVLCLDTIEHVPDPHDLAREMMRVLRAGGTCMVTTPARLRFLWGPDPHYAINKLLLLPDRLQGWVATKLLRRVDSYDVNHIYWHASEITGLFPGPNRVEIKWSNPFPFRTSIMNRAWWYARRALWDRILIHKI